MATDFKIEPVEIESLFEAAPIELRSVKRYVQRHNNKVKLELMSCWPYLPSVRCVEDLEGRVVVEQQPLLLEKTAHQQAWLIHRILSKKFNYFYVNRKLHEARSIFKRIFRHMVEASPRIEAYFNRGNPINNPIKPEVEVKLISKTPWPKQKKSRLERLLEQDIRKQTRIAARSRIDADGIYTGKRTPGYTTLEIEDILGNAANRKPTSAKPFGVANVNQCFNSNVDSPLASKGCKAGHSWRCDMEIDEVKQICDNVCETVEKKLGVEVARRVFIHEEHEGILCYPVNLKANKGKTKTIAGALTTIFGNCEVAEDGKELWFQFTWAATPALAG